jgi:GNAT superfamily N-acetyltransferase
VDAEVPELRALGSHYARAGGFLVAAELDGVVVGLAAIRPDQDHVWEVCKVYVAAAHRGAGLAQRLMAWTEARARAGGANALYLWSDTRFERAHRFYEKLGFVRSGPARALNDLSNSHEYPFRRAL